jgi:hypothetical protein
MTYNWNDILIVGDSFCSDRLSETDWPQALTCKLSNNEYDRTRIPNGAGFDGASWWSTRRCLMKELNKSIPKIIIFCHTEKMRIPSDYDYALNHRSVEIRELIPKQKKVMPEDLAKAAEGFYNHLLSHEFQDWTMRQWFHEIDWIMNKHQIEKVIHLYSFPDWHNKPLYKFKHGVTIMDPLYNYHKLNTDIERFPNHFNNYENVQFATFLFDIIENYPGHGAIYDKKIFE